MLRSKSDISTSVVISAILSCVIICIKYELFSDHCASADSFAGVAPLSNNSLGFISLYFLYHRLGSVDLPSPSHGELKIYDYQLLL